MKLKQISSTQFAGIRDCEVTFKDGINVVYGKNESGKSTLVNLISRTLFQNAKLDGRRDREFTDLYFPAAKRGSALVGDFVDGKLTLETERGTYTLSKEWGAEARCVLSTPDGVIRDQATIDTALKEVLVYGEGVYTDMLLSSQRGTDAALQTILDASKKTDAKREITAAVSQAFAESDGISMDAIEQGIQAKIEELAGKHWDYEREAPARKAGRWATGLGEVLKAYYAWEDAKAVLNEISALEQAVDGAAAEYAVKDRAVRDAEEAYEDFRVFANRLAVLNERKKEAARLRAETEKYDSLLAAWPVTEKQLLRAKELKTQQQNRAMLDRYETAKELYQTQQMLAKKVVERPCPKAAELTALRAAQRKVSRLENMLCGMNLSAVLKLGGGHTADIRVLRTGELLPLDGESITVTEAVTVSIPGVMELQLAPANVDVTALETELAAEKKVIAEIFEKYGVQTLEDLEELADSSSRAKSELDAAKARLERLLDGEAYEALEHGAQALPSGIRQEREIANDISELCRGVSLERFIAAAETHIEGYEREYGSVEKLTKLRASVVCDMEKTMAAGSGEDIPERYLSVSDPEAYLQELQQVLKEKQKLREEKLTNKTSAISRLETYKESVSGDPVDEAQKAENALREKKMLLAHWLHIAGIFAQQKETVRNDPMQDIADHFTRYLAVISDGSVSSEFPEGDKLNMHIYSRDRLLDYSKLSEGTKETVSLAFRLAVLDHLFPEGGGLIVLDDPFTDMDTERTAQACELVKACAKRHQVIFLTCKEEYISYFGETAISL